MANYDPRKNSIKVYQNLKAVKESTQQTEHHDEQKSQAVELYTYIATWGLMRLKGEDPALVNQIQKQKILRCFFQTLGELVYPNTQPNPLVGMEGMRKIIGLSASEYLGLTGVALQVAREFSFWAEALYPKQRSNNNVNQTTNQVTTVNS
ncbi:hypothetical protein [Umezakia ovalisporum]|uniref:CRISPR type III-B/RAMP module-associated protein Cmr5 n=2 Tax=Umezakia ovalisporum TaxID=75695 RepID=A0AA43H065_9CYAN|nr:hypothetical protein [Umezakia ovalisporum]MDH6058083.1 hypothetical protein [Umezakia ovalisporum FSS-43]MDH6064719.1 hypothetical protein [Umezakia ovalisporum FSS-62]MDH6066676.1 hypothetical protein [Umezakia ovalisporum APH033B]MDH6071572.1 hypothetical protein [Umezakia ovalisporum CobakiLakeA]MDH6073529.1 hypothetical protein [Umezakia ovalisporum CS-1034]